jgi:hypothetical protein
VGRAPPPPPSGVAARTYSLDAPFELVDYPSTGGDATNAVHPPTWTDCAKTATSSFTRLRLSGREARPAVMMPPTVVTD